MSAQDSPTHGGPQLIYHAKNYLKASVLASGLSTFNFLILTYILNVEEYGYLSIFNSLVSVFTILYLLNSHSGVARLLLDEREDWGEVLGANLMFTGLWVALLSTALWLSSSWLSERFALPEGLLFWACLVSALSCAYQYLMIYLSTDQQSARHARLSVRYKLIAVLLGLSLVLSLSEGRYLGKIYAEVIIAGAFGLYALRELLTLARFKVKLSHLSVSLRYGLPLIPHTLSRYILGYFDQLQINQLSGGVDTGRYSFAANIALFMGFIVTAAGKAWHPIFISKYHEGATAELESLSAPYANKIFLASCALSILTGELIYLVVPKPYHAGVPLIPIIVLGYVFVFIYTLYFQYSSYRKRTELISIATLLAGALNIALNAHFIPQYGYQAAAYTTVASFMALLALHYANARLILKEDVLRFRRLLPGLLTTTLITLSASYLYGARETLSASLRYSAILSLIALALFMFYQPKGGRHDVA